MKLNKQLFFSIAMAITILSSCGGKSEPPKTEKLVTHDDSLVYAIGMSTANMMVREKIEIKPDLMYWAMKDIQSGKTLLDEKQMDFILGKFDQEMRRKAMQNRANAQQHQQQGPDMQQAGANKVAGDAFLATHKSEAGIKTTASGLQYKVIKAGAGKKPTIANQVKINYRGTLLDGTEFDSSDKHGGPATFPLTNLIRGWQEGLPLMNTGAKYDFWIPAELAYGLDAPPNIGPNQTLYFSIELLDVLPPAAPQQNQERPR